MRNDVSMNGPTAGTTLTTNTTDTTLYGRVGYRADVRRCS
jgi:hypothetical protein